MAQRRGRILVAKPGLDGHDRGAKVVARALRDAGFEVIYTGLHQTPEMIANAALQEGVDAVGLSVMSGAHLTLFPAVVEALRAVGAGDVLVFGGGIIPDADVPVLERAGVAKLFRPGTSTQAVVDWLEANLGRQRQEPAAMLAGGEGPCQAPPFD
ncbi:MAG: cobalamin B12-binding domain-containing protein [Myxococcales bacterium]